jgi:glycine/D-amino acid oxidase-like deaminating enzyme
MRDADAQTIVLGAGLVGAACALRLAEAGRDVLLLDAQVPGQAASFGNAGHIATEQVFPLASPQVIRASWRYLLDADSPLRIRAAYLLPILPWLARFVWAARPMGFARGIQALMALQATSLADLHDLLAHAGVAGLLHADGYLRVWETPGGARDAQAQAVQVRPFGVNSAVWDADAVRRAAPGLASGVAGGVFYPDTGHVDDPHAVCTGLVAALVRAGGRVQQARAVALQQDSGGSVLVRQENGPALRCRELVLCTGAWSRPLAASLGYRVPLDTERGYHITMPWPASEGAAPGTRAWLDRPVASVERNVIMTPMSVGLRMTGTVEFGGLLLPPDAHRLALLRRAMRALVPASQPDTASTWMGFRPSLPDHLPVVCAAPRHPGVFFAFGHQHLGLTLCGVTARLVADLVCRRKPSVDMAPFHVDRFY